MCTSLKKIRKLIISSGMETNQAIWLYRFRKVTRKPSIFFLGQGRLLYYKITTKIEDLFSIWACFLTFILRWSWTTCLARARTASGSTLDWGRIMKSIDIASGLEACCLEDDCPDFEPLQIKRTKTQIYTMKFENIQQIKLGLLSKEATGRLKLYLTAKIQLNQAHHLLMPFQQIYSVLCRKINKNIALVIWLNNPNVYYLSSHWQDYRYFLAAGGLLKALSSSKFFMSSNRVLLLNIGRLCINDIKKVEVIS